MTSRSQRHHAAVPDTGAFDETFDVVVVGYGFAGGIAAIEAADAGASVLICEKMPNAGGLSICSGGTLRCAADAEGAFQYLKATNAGRTPDDVTRALADGMAVMKDYVGRLIERVDGASFKPEESMGKRAGNYPFAGVDAFFNLQVQLEKGYDRAQLFPQVRTRPGSGGPEMFWVINENITQRGIEVRKSTPVLRLIRAHDNEVRGVVVGSADGERRIGANRAVILACGGFEWNDEMKQQYWEGMPVLTASSRGNTGDGIRMAQSLGAELWHMWHFHGCYAFKHPDPDFPFALRVKRLPDWNPARKGAANVAMVWIVVDQNGRRYMNECPPYAQDTGHRPMHQMDPETMRYPRIPSFLITDERGSAAYQLGDIRTNDHQFSYDWSPDNSKELKLGILKRAESVEALARLIKADAKALAATIARWNTLCAAGEDSDFGRPPGTMVDLKPPFIVGEVWPTVSNTQGGPVHDPRQRIIDVGGKPIPRLYSAGEMGSSFGHLYLSGGNLAECFVTGWIAGREAAGLASWR